MKKLLTLSLALIILVGLMPWTVHAADSGLTLDSVAWEKLSFADIFEKNNAAYVNGFDNNKWPSFSQYAGKNTITGDARYSSPYSLKATGSSSQQIASNNSYKAGDYFVASKVYCTRYSRGKLGVCIGSTTVGISAKTSGFVTASGIISNGGSNKIYIGSIHSANLDGYVDDPVVINMNIFKTRPTKDQLTALYEQYLEIKTGGDHPQPAYTDQQMYDAFMAYLQKKAKAIGMNSSTFGDPLGNICNLTTARDIMTLLIHADTYPQLDGIWSQSSQKITITGSRARTTTVISSVIKPELEDYYHILGGKTGTLTGVNNLAAILEIPNSKDRLAVVVLYANAKDGYSGNRFQAARQVADAAMKKYKNPGADVSKTTVSCASAMACLLPADGSAPVTLYSKDPDTQRYPASLTKMLTAVCAMDYIRDLDSKITYKQFDIDATEWYYYDFYAGDVVSFRDALAALLLPSSNVTSMTLARSGGYALLTHSHSYDVVVTAPTCTAKGYSTYTCYCGDSFVDDYVAAAGHRYGEWSVITAPTCTKAGQERHDCNYCDHYETRVAAATGHSWGPWETVTDPTLTETGLRQRQCDRCGGTEQEELPKLDFLYGDANGDGEINGKDLILLRQFLASWNVQLDEAASDTNGDGEINGKDLILLRQFLASWNVTLGPGT